MSAAASPAPAAPIRVAAGTTAAAAVRDAGLPSRGASDAIVVIRHSAAHVLAQAVQEMFPEAKLGIGPPITDGFYYDFDVAEAFTPEDLEALEKRMRQIVKDLSLI